jgi:signal transduction histidine kinase
MESKQPTAAGSGHGIEVLVVEDSPTQAVRLKLTLEQQGYQVTVARDGKQALAALEMHRPSVVISDIVMPEMNGYELCRRIKAHEGLKDIPVILLTSLSNPEDVISALECKADNFILKPFDDQFLLARVHYLTANHKPGAEPTLQGTLGDNNDGGAGAEVFFAGEKYFLGAMPRVETTIGLLLGIYENAVQKNSELIKAKKEAERANLAKSEFLSRMSHELRTPLNAILGFGQILEMQNLGPQASEGIGHILKGGKHLLELINEVLDIARVEAGHLELSLEPAGVREILRDAADLIRPLAGHNGIRLDVSARAISDSYVLADEQRLKQVLINLLSNAVKYNYRGGSITLSCVEGTVGRIRIEVTDTGPGIAAHDLEKLFVPFERLGAEKSGIEGTGLGLAFSRRLVEAMGGTLTVESPSEQGTLQGSTFTVELPRAETPVPLEAAPGSVSLPDDPLEGKQSPAPTKTVLSIEDNASNISLIETILSMRPGIKLLGAMQGRVGLDLALQHCPDLILLDLQLPDIMGHEVLRQLQEAAQTRDIPVVIVSADATAPQIERLLVAGARAYLTKPLNVTQLLGVVDEMLKDEEA